MRLLDVVKLDRPIAKLRVHPSASHVATFSASTNALSVWTWQSGRLEQTFEVSLLPAFRTNEGSPSNARAQIIKGMITHRSTTCRDVAFHPKEDALALVGDGRRIEIYRTTTGDLGCSMGSFGSAGDRVTDVTAHLLSNGVRDTQGGLVSRFESRVSEFHRLIQGYCNVTFSAGGGRVAACSTVDFKTEVYDFEVHRRVGSFFGSNSRFVTHADLPIVACARNDQLGCSIQFVELAESFEGEGNEFGWGAPRVRMSEREDEFGWSPSALITSVDGMAFNEKGDLLLVTGGIPEFGKYFGLYEFPSLSEIFCRRFALSGFEEPDELSDDPVIAMFHPDGLHILVPLPNGLISELDVSTGSELRRWRAHDDFVTCFEMRKSKLLTASINGELKIWTI
jgi:WD40 repeat protein